MTAEQQGGQVAPAEAPARDTGPHTREDHKAASSKRTYGKGTSVTAPFQEAASLPAPSLKPEK
jgi:hypothetical protein